MEAENQQPQKEKVTTYSLRPKGEVKLFIDAVVREKGSIAQALEHCVRLAMAASSGVPRPVPTPPVPKPVPAPAGIVLTSTEVTQLEKIQRSKNKSQREAISFSINYTYRNAWL